MAKRVDKGLGCVASILALSTVVQEDKSWSGPERTLKLRKIVRQIGTGECAPTLAALREMKLQPKLPLGTSTMLKVTLWSAMLITAFLHKHE